MTDAGIEALIIPRADEYLGEYVPAHNERLQWISGFTGSAGTAIILPERAAIFVDGRYTIQARQQVSSALFDFHHLIDEPPLDWLLDQLGDVSIGVDSRLHTYRWYKETQERCGKAGIDLIELKSNPIDDNWQDRPLPERNLVTLLGEQYTGESSESKRRRIGKAIEDQGADLAIISQLDSIAWLLNIRGGDIPCLPVLMATALLRADGSMTLFTDPMKIPNDLAEHVGSGVVVESEANAAAALTSLTGLTVLADPDTTSAFNQLRSIDAGATLVAAQDPVMLPKAQKNAVELEGMRNCHIRDGSALTRFLAWLQEQVSQSHLHNEATLADQLRAFREELSDIRDLSFDTISAAGANAAIVHYDHRNGEPASLTMDSLYLVDSGGQYLDGTTDLTRTVAIGIPTDEHRRMFTLVLKGHIALARNLFPKGTTGVQLDVLARQHLWQEGLDYDHGTGHGVGSYLSVHEGPQRISKKAPCPALLPGMVISNEPGFYKEGDFGIRCENLMVVCEAEHNMLGFETITFAPFDRALMDISLMSPSEIDWVNQYHNSVARKISHLVNDEERAWLESATAPLA